MPSTERLFTVKIPVKIKDNPNSGVKGITTLTVKGIGKTLQLRVEPTALTLPPTMPHADVVTADFQLVNPTDYPIEVYSVEFDDQWFKEVHYLLWLYLLRLLYCGYTYHGSRTYYGLKHGQSRGFTRWRRGLQPLGT